MSAPIFTWTEDWGGEDAFKPRVLAINYGDGYRQRTGNGLNTIMANYPVTFSVRSMAEANAIKAFLDAQAGVTAFSFTPYGDSAPSLWTCSDYKRKHMGIDNFTITAVFQQELA